VWEGAPDDEAVETLEFAEVEGGTLMASTVRHTSVEARDMHVASGMETGIIESYERLDELVAEEQSA
jgi:hypothetical protein